ncbi:AmpG family muropeptide MFS transporter [Desulforhopalus singaporensis]|uniref:MFS transporter, PAT family, beta-lactamase induction signal transducer AmpG n=1 Tax=Desulforhopalus singaporensis TaxID=91360 RepID=A0A1H0P3L1_9BACT|nr:MFS transporter [Desulforhopalus singaporensis]SDO99544.1 MFS transporter, PAT family, beta-lactamase induction signal transducer AmpG [Desulforhopalus singaporensis]
MSRIIKEKRSWGQTMKAWLQPKAVALLFLGFAAGIPLLLIFSTLSVWLTEAGVERSAVTFFSWAALGYSFKFLWAPLVDLLPLPVLTRLLGRRRSWMLLSQMSIIGAILWMSSINPVSGEEFLTVMALAAVMLGFSSATQDIVIDAYRIECAEESMQALLASMYIVGYRSGMLVAGAGSLFLADYLGTTSEMYSYGAWSRTYMAMAAIMTVGVATTLVIAEPGENRKVSSYSYSADQYFRLFILFLFCMTTFGLTFFNSSALFDWIGVSGGQASFFDSVLGSFLRELIRFSLAAACSCCAGLGMVRCKLVDMEMASRSYVDPIREFFQRYGARTALLILMLVGFYRLSDIVFGVVSNIFYIDLGFSKNVIGGVTKTFGFAMTLVGCFLGGTLSARYGVHLILFLGAVLSAATNLLFMALAGMGSDVMMLAAVIGADNISAGIATTAFVAYLSSLTNISFTATQYAIFSSLMTLLPKLFGGYSGVMVSGLGYSGFFLLTAVLGIPVMFLVWLVHKRVA